MPTPDALTANELRALAEEADGLRNHDAVIVRDADPAARRRYRVMRADQMTTEQPVLAIRTDDDPRFVPRRPAFALHSHPPVQLQNHPGLTLASCDAVFTSLSAFDKFVLPYYAQMRRLDDVKAARERFASTATALAVVHLPNSIDDTVSAAGALYALVADDGPGGESPTAGASTRAAPPTVALQGLLHGFIRR
jgi:hypothetical protein